MKHAHLFVKISETKEKCALCDQFRKVKKDKEAHKIYECEDIDNCDIHIGNCFTDAFGGGSIIEQIKNPLGKDHCKCLEPWIMQAHEDYMCEKCGKRYG